MSKKIDPCSVCGGTDLNLVDGYYYCVECGTQDATARETIVIHAAESFFHTARTKITTVVKEGIQKFLKASGTPILKVLQKLFDSDLLEGTTPEAWNRCVVVLLFKRVSGEWYKWHAYNFILNGLADELIALGVNPTFKRKLLWIWLRYIKKYQDKEKMGISKNTEETLDSDESTEIEKNDDSSDEDDNVKKKVSYKDIKSMSKNVILAMLYVALNLDQSDVMLSDLFRFIKEGKLSLANCEKFIPKDIKKKEIPKWKSFAYHIHLVTCQYYIRAVAFMLFKKLDLGQPIVPDLRKIVEKYVTELCLPDDFKKLVLALLHRFPFKVHIKGIRIPEYATIVMAYVLIAFKMCFGLDDDCEIKLSDIVEKINTENNYPRRYKLTSNIEVSDRYISFREWSNHLQLRKLILSKHLLSVAKEYNYEYNDYVFMEELAEINKSNNNQLSNEVTLSILDKMPLHDDSAVIPKNEFYSTLTPMSTYTNVVLDYIQLENPDLRLLLSEDFTKYSMNFILFGNFHDLCYQGVSSEGKVIKDCITGNVGQKYSELNQVYIRNCDNKNWLKTNRPNVNHVVYDETVTDKINENIDYGYDSTLDITPPDNEYNTLNEVESNNLSVSPEAVDSKDEQPLEIIIEEDEDNNIFDDDFKNIKYDDYATNNDGQSLISYELRPESSVLEAGIANNTFHSFHLGDDILDNKSDMQSEKSTLLLSYFNPLTFNREEMIEQLVLLECEKYKIRMPKEYRLQSSTIKTRKRKAPEPNTDIGHNDEKKHKLSIPGTGNKNVVHNILTAYYSNLEKNLMNKTSDYIKSVIGTDEYLDNNIGENENVNIENNFSTDIVDTEINQLPDESSIREELLLKDYNSSDSETEGDRTIPKGDPRFDDQIYDPTQLYIKVKKEINENKLFDEIKDVDIEKILEKKLKEENIELYMTIDKSITKCASDSIRQLLENPYNIPRTRLVRGDSEDLSEFYYWIRVYHSKTVLHKMTDIKEKFDLELLENFPKSFVFVIQECAKIANCTAFSLYKHLQNIEKEHILEPKVLNIKGRAMKNKAMKERANKSKLYEPFEC